MGNLPAIETPVSSGATDQPNAPQSDSNVGINEASARAAGYPVQHDWSKVQLVGAPTPVAPSPAQDFSQVKLTGTPTPVSTQPPVKQAADIGQPKGMLDHLQNLVGRGVEA